MLTRYARRDFASRLWQPAPPPPDAKAATLDARGEITHSKANAFASVFSHRRCAHKSWHRARRDRGGGCVTPASLCAATTIAVRRWCDVAQPPSGSLGRDRKEPLAAVLRPQTERQQRDSPPPASPAAAPCTSSRLRACTRRTCRNENRRCSSSSPSHATAVAMFHRSVATSPGPSANVA